MNYSKLSLCVLATMLCGSAFANNFYVGAGAGFNTFNDKMTITDNLVSANDASASLGQTGWLGNIFAGYVWHCPSKFNLGLEGFAGHSSAKASATDVSGTLNVYSRYNYGLRLVPGYQLTPDTEVHALVGYVRGAFRIKDDNFVTTTSDNFNENGYQVGVGAGTDLIKNLALRVDLTYSGYRASTYTENVSGDTISYRNRLSSTSGLVSVAYSFG